MIKGIEGILIGSEDATSLAHFYKDKLGLEIKEEGELGEEGDNIFEMKISEGSSFYIVDHSKIKGKNNQPQRIIINFEVKREIEEAVKKLEDNGVNKIADIYHVEDYGYIATFEDIDGNYFQLVKTKP